MKKYYIGGIITLLFLSLPLLVWLYVFYETEISSDSDKWSDFGSFIGGTISPVLAFASFIAVLITIKLQKQKNDYEKDILAAQVYCDNAVKCLSRAYNFLSDDGKSSSPVKDRLVWLTAARLIKQADRLSNLISAQALSSQTMYESEKEYWHHKFYKLIDFTSTNSFSTSKDYFSKASSILGDEIEERSIKVIYQFALQFDSDNDPIDEISWFTREELKQFNVGQSGLTQYLEGKITMREQRT